MIISIVVETASDEIQHLLLIKTKNKNIFLNLIVGIYENPTLIFNVERYSFPPKIGKKVRISTLSSSIQQCPRASNQ